MFIANNLIFSFPKKNLKHLRCNLFYPDIISLFTLIWKEGIVLSFLQEQPSPDVSMVIPLYLSFSVIIHYHPFLSLALSSLHACLNIPLPGLPNTVLCAGQLTEASLNFEPAVPLHFYSLVLGAWCSCCSVAQLCPTLCNTMNCSMAGSSVLHYLLGFVHWVGDTTWPSHPLPPPSPFAFSLS